MHREGGSTIFQTINLETYYILEIETWPPGWMSSDSEQYEPTELDQKEALLALATAWKDKEWEDSARKGEPKVAGESSPKRLEIVIEDRAMVAKRLLVIDVVSPAGHFEGFTVAGRLYNEEQWEEKTTHFYSLSAAISKIEAYLRAGTAYTSESFTQYQQKPAWEALHNFFTKFTVEELEALRKWQPKKVAAACDDDDDDEAHWAYCYETGQVWSPGKGNWTQRTPYSYRPKEVKPAYYRVAGDKVGAILHQDQLERRRKTQAQASGEVGALVEKKSEAGAQEPLPQTPGSTPPGSHNVLRNRGPGPDDSSRSGPRTFNRFRLNAGLSGRGRGLIVAGKVIAPESDTIH